ncbi:MAG TPA: PAS domain S-box protein [Candidatus Acidoferrales bacterium]|nr:PAS domain S-box protein [Candidatus Acidoferrales bacterium]
MSAQNSVQPPDTSPSHPPERLAVAESALEMRQLLETAFDAIVEIDSSGLITGWNAKAESTFGWPRGEVLGRPLVRTIAPSRFEGAYARTIGGMLTAGETPAGGRFELTARHRTGREIHLELASVLLGTGPSRRLSLLARDVTRQEQLERELRISEERTRAILDRIEDGCFEVELSEAARYLFVNRGFCQITGYTAEELVGRSYREFFDAETIGKLDAAYRGVFRTGEPLKAFEYALTRKDGARRQVEESVALKRNSRGEPVAFIGIRRDCTERKVAEEKLRDSEERYREILEQIEDGYFELDLAGRYLLVNNAFCRMLHCPPEELLGETYKKVIPAHQVPAIYEVFHRLYETGEPIKPFEYETLRQDGSTIVVEAAPCLRRDRQGQPIGFHGIVRDITERKQAEKELARAKEAAETANKAKSGFLATMSHEIRTPMNGILGMTELVLDTGLTEEQRECLGLVKSSAESLLSLINDILDFSRIEAGRLDLESIPFDLRPSLDEAMKSLSYRAQQKGLELIYDVRPDVPEKLVGDPTRIRQVLVNLVGNALKFTEKGEILVTVGAQASEPEPGGGVGLEFAVADTGIGIPPDKHRRIFNPFSQADESMTRKYGGTGLGLTVCFRLVEEMGGRIWVESEPGKGSTFRFTLRLQAQNPSSEAPVAVPPELLRDMPVLVVDDNSTNRRVLGGMLLRWGMKPVGVESGKAALEALDCARREGHAFPLVLLDGQMPEMDGFAVAERIQQDPELAGMAVVMLTSAGRMGDAARCRELNISSHLTKPVRSGELLEAIGRAARKMAAAPAARWPEKRMESGARPPLKLLLVENDTVNRKLAAALLAKRGFEVTATRDGKATLAALEGESFDLILMDAQIPGMDGFETAAVIRQREKPGGIRMPIVAMMVHASTADQQRCLAAGMDGCVSKPIRISEIVDTVERVLSGRAPAETAGERGGSRGEP